MQSPGVFVLLLAVWCRTASATDQKQGVTLDTYVRQLGYQGAKWEASSAHRPLVEATLSNGKSVICLVDTGDKASSLSEDSAKGLKTLGELGVELKDSVWGRVTNSNVCLAETLKVGPATFYNHPARIVKVKTTMPCTATFGYDFLLRNYCLLDFGGRFIYFRAGKPSAEQTEALDESLRNAGFREINIPRGWPM